MEREEASMENETLLARWIAHYFLEVIGPRKPGILTRADVRSVWRQCTRKAIDDARARIVQTWWAGEWSIAQMRDNRYRKYAEEEHAETENYRQYLQDLLNGKVRISTPLVHPQPALPKLDPRTLMLPERTDG